MYIKKKSGEVCTNIHGDPSKSTDWLRLPPCDLKLMWLKDVHCIITSTVVFTAYIVAYTVVTDGASSSQL